MDKENVFESFKKWKRLEGSPLAETRLEDWNIQPYKDSYLLTPGGGRRSNRAFLMKEGKGISFSPSVMRLESAYDKLASDAHSTGNEDRGTQEK